MKTLLVFKVFVCGGGAAVLNKHTKTKTDLVTIKATRHQEHDKGSYNCLYAYNCTTPQISLHYTLIYNVRIKARLNSVLITP